MTCYNICSNVAGVLMSAVCSIFYRAILQPSMRTDNPESASASNRLVLMPQNSTSSSYRATLGGRPKTSFNISHAFSCPSSLGSMTQFSNASPPFSHNNAAVTEDDHYHCTFSFTEVLNCLTRLNTLQMAGAQLWAGQHQNRLWVY